MCGASLEEHTETECRNLRAQRHLGRLALVDTHGPVISRSTTSSATFGGVPDRARNQARHGRRGRAGPFEVDAVDEVTRTSWSVVVRGALAEILDPEDLERLRTLLLYAWAPGEKTRYLYMQLYAAICTRPSLPVAHLHPG